MTAIAGHGLHVVLPRRWEGRLYRRDVPALTGARSTTEPTFARSATHPAAFGHPDESPNPVLHLANFALPPGRGDFGTGAVERMSAQHVFLALVEYDREEAGRALFAARGVPRPAAHDFAPNALQRRIAGQLGCQRFFTVQGRAFCLYAVLGSQRHAVALVTDLHAVLDGVQVSA